MMHISEPFARILAAGRGQFNQRVLEARRRYPALDTEAFAGFLKTGVDPVVQAVASAAPERLPSVALIAYDIALDLTGLALVGPKARSALVELAWQDVVPEFAPLISRQPAATLGALTNAIVYIESIATARPAQWIEEMAVIAPHIETLPQLQAVGQIIAWRAGVAHFRAGAISVAVQLPEALAMAAFGLASGGSWTLLREQLLADPWFMTDAGAAKKASKEFGSFSGFGGEFPMPPEVRACPDGFVVKSADRYHVLIADAYGAVLHGSTMEEFEQSAIAPSQGAFSLDGSTLQIKERKITLDLPENQLAVCCNAHTVAVTSPYTHAIRLLPLL